ncbi:NUDIX domain-containing protein [Deinococcus cavernae]|uniref:NUDIX domain-containing protein n=1 Tax=Deinococcus cavernae TaxID=2320857 RepID=A0A418VCB6_9DEIO|nr:NUDIX domain-containing protein [Deinococcus cavernae]RJF73649.1 NUDIX domain-containing protein [Deinococcus cavernae]
MKLRAVWGNRPILGVAAGALIQDEQGRVLLQRRGDDGRWGEPGGGVNPGEDFLSGVQRELLEETGLDCPNLTWLGLEDGVQSGERMFLRYPNGHEMCIVDILFHGSLPAAALEHAQPDDSGETLELRWFPLDDLPELSSNINRNNLNILRRRAGMPELPLGPVPPLDLSGSGTFWADFRQLVGPQQPLFLPGASVLLTDEQGRLLLLKHANSGDWVLPGGKLDPGESLEDCARRETFEETGLSVTNLKRVQLLAGPEFRFTDHQGVWDSVGMIYEAQGVTGDLRLPAGEIEDACWFTPGELCRIRLLGLYTEKAVEHWVKSRRVEG